ncbi:hypothetical protein ABID59_005643 [Bradyrhizobium sp. S3.3.6]
MSHTTTQISANATPNTGQPMTRVVAFATLISTLASLN